jgi:hypothetical protein
MASSLENAIELPDGRRLAYCECGARDGAPVFFFHGWPGSRLDFAPNDATAAAAGVRVIAVDRPGIGGSAPQGGRKVLDWPTDVAALADSLALDRFAVLGFSFGGPTPAPAPMPCLTVSPAPASSPVLVRSTIRLPNAAWRLPHAMGSRPHDSRLGSRDRWSRSPRGRRSAAR